MNNPSHISFEHLIDPLTIQSFFDDYFEKKPLLIKRHDRDFFSGLLQLEDVETILNTEDILGRVNMRMVKNGNPIPFNRYMQIEKIKNVEVKSTLLLDEVWQLFNREKATFVLEQTKGLWPALSDLLLSVNDHFHCSANANIYISPPGACGFNVHYDSHDVFVLQIAGTKHWKIYSNPYYLPLGIHNSIPFDVNNLELLYDIELEEGDTLYMPRGFVHEASTSDNLSAHITAGIYNVTLAKVLSDYVVRIAANDALLRQSLLAVLNRPGLSEAALIEKIASSLTSNLNIAALRKSLASATHTDAGQTRPLFNALVQS